MTSRAKPRKQCAKCPWKVTTDPHTIPNGYREELHCGLSNTIAKPGDVSGMGEKIRMFACHETLKGRELPCVGWLVQQLGPGNNIPLRLRVISGQIDANVVTVGRQHESFERTLPQKPDTARSR